MIVDFGSTGTEDIFHGNDTPAARKTLPKNLWPVAVRKLDMINAAADVMDLRSPPGNRLEKLQGDRAGSFSIRINGQYRITFVWANGQASDVLIEDYH